MPLSSFSASRQRQGNQGKTNDSLFSDDTDSKELLPLSSYISPSWYAAFFYAGAFSLLMTFLYMLGKSFEYRIPVSQNPFSFSVFLLLCGFFLCSLLSMYVFYRILGKDVASPNTRIRRMNFFSMYFATFFTASYLSIISIYCLRGGDFYISSLFVVALFLFLISLYLKQKKSLFEHIFFALLSALILMIIAFHSGKSVAVVEDKMITAYNAETFALLKTDKDKTILLGYNPTRNTFTGRMLMVSPEISDKLVFSQYSPFKTK